MASSSVAVAPPTRRALSDMSVNTPVGNKTPKKNLKDGKLFGEIGVEGKRHGETGGGESVAKRRRVEVEEQHDDPGRQFLSPTRELNVVSRSPSMSPSSSYGNNTTELNDTQNTLLTIPDEVPRFDAFSTLPLVVTPPPQLTAAQMRAKATSIRLRLTLASYKLRTNQIDVPISRLEIRPSQTPNLPQLRRSASNSHATSMLRNKVTSIPPTSQPLPFKQRTYASTNTGASESRRTALPTAPTSTSQPLTSTHPNAQNYTHAAHDEPGFDMASSPPRPPSSHATHAHPASPTKGRDMEAEEFTTPILPRQRAGLINPPFLGGRDEDVERDLTSSVVKGRAADGLLRLMGVVRE